MKVFLDAEALAQAAAKSSEEARRLQEEGASATPGRAYMLRKRREEALTREATTLQRKTLEGVLGALQAQAGAVHVDSLPTHEPSSVRLALKVSALVAVDRQDAFHAAVQAAQGSY